MRFALATLLLFSVGCSTPSDQICFPPAPTWIPPSDTRIFTHDEILRRAALEGVQVRVFDRTYSFVSRKWVERFTDWTWEVSRILEHRTGKPLYTVQSFDCEDFANLFTAVSKKKAGDAGVLTSPLIGPLVIDNGDGSTHSIVLVATDEGVFVIEPQPTRGYRIWPLADVRARIRLLDL